MKLNKKGYSNLVIVFMLSTFMTLILFALLLTSYLDSKRVAQIVDSKKAYYFAEAAMNETILEIRNSPAVRPDDQTYMVADAEVTRETTEDPPDCPIRVELNSKYKNAKRKISACFETGAAMTVPLDIVLVTDHSGSMENGSPTSLRVAKDAGKSFVDVVNNKAIQEDVAHRIGVVLFGGSAEKKSSLHSVKSVADMNLIKNAIEENRNCGGSTNIADGIYMAREELKNNGRDDSIKVILILSDGVPQKAYSSCSCRSNECTCSFKDGCNPMSNAYKPHYEGKNEGNCCTNDAIEQAEKAKNEDGFIIFSIHLGKNYKHTADSLCGDDGEDDVDGLAATKKLGRLTLLRVSNEPPDQTLPEPGETRTYYKETDEDEELENIYNEIAESITLPTFGTLSEEVPDPDF